jgi:hypothetical protein
MRNARTRGHAALGAGAVAAMVALAACSSSSPSPDAPADTSDAGSVSSDATADVAYLGVTHGGNVPPAPPYVEADAGTLTYDATIACCPTRLAISGTGTEVSVQVVGDLPPFDGTGLALSFAGGYWTAAACIPLAEAVAYRFATTSADGDGGLVTQYTIDPDVTTVTDGNGVSSNVVSLLACSDVPDGGIVVTLADAGAAPDGGEDADAADAE